MVLGCHCCAADFGALVFASGRDDKKRGTKHLDGRVACKLVADNYGRSEWWVLLEPVAS